MVRFLGRRVHWALFFLNEAAAAVSVNGLRYRTMINEFLWPELKDMDVDDVYYQQDSATCYTSGETPPNFFLWGYVKDKVYADAPQWI